MTSKLSILLNIILIAVIAFGVNKFVIQGSTAPSDDGRTALLIAPSEKDYVLTEMRAFLETVQGITTAIGEDDMAKVSTLAAKAGKFSPANVPAPLFAKMPLEFKTLGMETHTLFENLAKTAAESGSAQAVSVALGDLMLNCTACHSSYRLDLEPLSN